MGNVQDEKSLIDRNTHRDLRAYEVAASRSERKCMIQSSHYPRPTRGVFAY